MFNNRKELPTCEYGTFEEGNPDLEGDCGEPAVASWDWGDGAFFVCEDHDQVVQESEQGEDP